MSRMLFKIFFLLAIQGVLARQNASFLNPIIVDKGEVAYIPCQTSNRTENVSCVWFWNGLPKPINNTKYVFDKKTRDGDCGIIIFDVQLAHDEGLWRCEMKLGNRTISTHSVNLTVSEVPKAPSIRYRGHNGSAFRAGQPYSLECHSEQGNPRSVLKWFLDDEEITDMAHQADQLDSGKPKSWKSISVLDFAFDVKDNNKTLTCVSEHSGSEFIIQNATIRPTIMYAPRISGISTNIAENQDIVEGTTLVLKCEVDANPKPAIVWIKSHRQMKHRGDEIIFSKVLRSDSGVYTCFANNSLGMSEKVSETIDVKFAPQIIHITSFTPSGKVNLYQAVTFFCMTDANPEPKYSWLKKMPPSPEEWKEISPNPTLYFENVDYEAQGTYVCVASNTINGKSNIKQSKEIFLDITGPPQIIFTKSSSPAVIASRGESTIMIVHFCSDPPAHFYYWILYNGKILEPSKTYSSFSASKIKAVQELTDCYEAKLTLEHPKNRDSGTVTFIIINQNGTAKFSSKFDVKGLDTDVIAGVTVTISVLIVLMIGFTVFQIKKMKLNTTIDMGSEAHSMVEILPHRSKPSTSRVMTSEL